MHKTLEWHGSIDGSLDLLDQRLLPNEVVRLECTTVPRLIDAIKTLAVRGAPAIGVAAGFGLVLALQNVQPNINTAIRELARAKKELAASRPTAVNLFYALDRVNTAACQFTSQCPTASINQLREIVLAQAQAIYDEDVEMCRRIGQNGAPLIPDGGAVLTHCNAGALATAGQGTALSLLYEAARQGKRFRVYVDETRPLLQGARLTAWECKQAGLDAVLICDNMAGSLMKAGKINAVLTGADRIAANGDTANKIGTYSLSVLAKYHAIPFYIAAPSSTFDLSIASGTQIPIEERSPAEVTAFAGKTIAPTDIAVYNPAFDVTDAANISAIITERGIINDPDSDNIRLHLA
jgi:methylthioribose-1-phosphate isomerase